jgi:hypothetical protein
MSALPQNLIIQTPAGTWTLVGSVDASLLYIMADGSPCHPSVIKAIREASNPAMATKYLGAKNRRYATREGAETALEALKG